MINKKFLVLLFFVFIFLGIILFWQFYLKNFYQKGVSESNFNKNGTSTNLTHQLNSDFSPTTTISQSQKIDQIRIEDNLSTSPTPSKTCSITTSPYPYFRDLQVDLDNDSKKELVRLYEHKDCHRTDSVILKFFEKINNDCFIEKFTFPPYQSQDINYFNLVRDFSVYEDFFGDKKPVVFFEALNNSCGSGEIRKLFFFYYKDSQYKLVEGPVINENDHYLFFNYPKGKYILIAQALWEKDDDCHSCPHRYQIFLYWFDGFSYQKKMLTETKLKYSPDVSLLNNEVLKKTFFKDPQLVKDEVERLGL